METPMFPFVNMGVSRKKEKLQSHSQHYYRSYKYALSLKKLLLVTCLAFYQVILGVRGIRE